MARQQMTLRSLGEIDSGKIGIAFTRLVTECAKDVTDRPGDKSKRSVVVRIDFTPEQGGDGISDRAAMEVTLHANVPKRRSRRYALGVQGNGQMFFNPDAIDDPYQGTLDEVVEGQGEQ